MAQNIWNIINVLLIINTIFAIITVFRQRDRDIASVWAWLLVLVLLPGIGFIIYVFLGRKISGKDIYNLQQQVAMGLPHYLDEHEEEAKRQHRLFNFYRKFRGPHIDLANMFLEVGHSTLTTNNQIELITDGHEKFDQLLEDLSRAKHHIHICYYIFRSDDIGSQILRILENKAAEGVEIRFLYDPFGARSLRQSKLKKLRQLGGEVETSFGESVHLLNFRLNYRNHRKIVIIDGEIGYTGGFNVGDDYLGKYPKMGYWRDTHLRIEGDAVRHLQARFFIDWNASRQKDPVQYRDFYFPEASQEGNINAQIVASGPNSETQVIKKGYLKMISMAQESVYIQTPYLIPDDALIETLEIAVHSGVDVKIMIPNKPDHPFIYRATLSYASQLVETGAEVYIYDAGFLHAKTIVVDDQIVSVGTANFDIRSFKLNFEINCFMYSEEMALEQSAAFKEDCRVSYQLTEEMIANFSWWERFKQQFSRLLSPIL